MDAPTNRHLTIRLLVDGMNGVHAARALHTALGGIEGMRTADVWVGRALLEYTGSADDTTLEQALRSTLDLVGLKLRSVDIRQDRRLPIR